METRHLSLKQALEVSAAMAAGASLLANPEPALAQAACRVEFTAAGIPAGKDPLTVTFYNPNGALVDTASGVRNGTKMILNAPSTDGRGYAVIIGTKDAGQARESDKKSTISGTCGTGRELEFRPDTRPATPVLAPTPAATLGRPSAEDIAREQRAWLWGMIQNAPWGTIATAALAAAVLWVGGRYLRDRNNAIVAERNQLRTDLTTRTTERDNAQRDLTTRTAELATRTIERDDALRDLGVRTTERDDAIRDLGTTTTERNNARRDLTAAETRYNNLKVPQVDPATGTVKVGRVVTINPAHVGIRVPNVTNIEPIP